MEAKDRIAAASLGVALVSVGIAVWALLESSSTARKQQTLQEQIEERVSAPLLVPGVEPGRSDGRKKFQIVGSYKVVDKLANFLQIYWNPNRPDREPYMEICSTTCAAPRRSTSTRPAGA